MNKVVVDNVLYNKFYLDGNVNGFEDYKDEVSFENLEKLCLDSGITKEEIIDFTNEYNIEQNAVVVFQEKDLSASSSYELCNLVMLTGKLGKTGSGIIPVKEKNNSQGLIDMGIRHDLTVGGIPMTEEYAKKASELWGVEELDILTECPCKGFIKSKFKNFIIFGEDPIGTGIYLNEIKTWFKNREFVVVQDYFMTETARMADLILPATFHFETGGSFTNTQKFIQTFAKKMESSVEKNNIEQLAGILNEFGLKQSTELDSIFEEITKLLNLKKEEKPELINTAGDNYFKYFNDSCDIIMKKISKMLN